MSRPGVAWREQVPTLALVLLGIVLYARGMVVGFVADDLVALDTALRVPLGDLLSARHPVAHDYRPLSRELYWWWWGRLANLGAGGFHLVNLITYAGVALMIAGLARAWAGRRAGLLCAAAWVLYPPGSALLSWVSCAQELIALFWAAAALLLYRAGRRWPAGVVTVLAALSSEAAYALPLALAVMDWLLHPGARVRERLVRLAPSIAGAAVTLSLTHGIGVPRAPGGLAPWSTQRLPDAWQIPQGFARTFMPPDTGAGIARSVQEQVVWVVLLGVFAVLVVPRVARAAAGAKPAESVAPAARETRTLLGFGAALALLGLVPLAFLSAPWRGTSFGLSALGVSLALGALLAGPAPPVVARVALPIAALIHFGAGGLYRPRETAVGPVAHPYVNYAFIRDAAAITDRLLLALMPWCSSLHALPRTYAAGVAPDPTFVSVLGPGLRVACHDTTLRVRFLADFAPEDARGEFGVLRFDARNVRFAHERGDARVRARIGEGFLIHARYDVAAACFEAAAGGSPPDRELSYPLAVSLAAAGRSADARTVWYQARRRNATLDPTTMAGRMAGRLTPPGGSTPAAPAAGAVPDSLVRLAAGALATPWEAEPHRALGAALLALSRAREATLELSVAAGISRQMPDLARLGQGFEAIGALDEARAAYERALAAGLPADLYAVTRDRFMALRRPASVRLDRSGTRP